MPNHILTFSCGQRLVTTCHCSNFFFSNGSTFGSVLCQLSFLPKVPPSFLPQPKMGYSAIQGISFLFIPFPIYFPPSMMSASCENFNLVLWNNWHSLPTTGGCMPKVGPTQTKQYTVLWRCHPHTSCNEWHPWGLPILSTNHHVAAAWCWPDTIHGLMSQTKQPTHSGNPIRKQIWPILRTMIDKTFSFNFSSSSRIQDNKADLPYKD